MILGLNNILDRKISGQSAIEYLMTYGWMLLVVAVVGGAVFSVVGNQNIENVSGFNSRDINVQDFGVSTENGLMFSMSDPRGQTMVTEVTLSNSDSSNITYIVNQDISQQNNVNLPGVIPDDSDNKLEVEIKYKSGNLVNLTTSGIVQGALKTDKNFNNRTIIVDSLVGYWPLTKKYSSETKVYDLTTNNNHGALINNTEWTTNEQERRTLLELDGINDYVDASPHPLDGESPEEFTASARFKMNETPQDGWASVFSTRSGSNSEAFWVFIDEGNFPLDASFSMDFVDSARVHNNIKPSNVIEKNQWHHVTITWDGVEFKAYLDGELLDSYNPGDDEANIGDDFYIGWDGTNEYPFPGKIDDVKVYDRALSNGEVELLYESGKSLSGN